MDSERVEESNKNSSVQCTSKHLTRMKNALKINTKELVLLQSASIKYMTDCTKWNSKDNKCSSEVYL